VPAFGSDLASADDETIRAALEHAEVPALLPALAGALGEASLIPDHLRPDLSVLMDPTAGLSPGQLAEARALALGALKRLRQADMAAGPGPKPDELRRLLEFVSGGTPIDEYLELLREELALGEDLRAPNWRKDELAPQRDFRVAIIGAGMSGLAAAHRLRQAGLDVVVLEKNHGVGGTWLENTYPGCRVDVSNHFYSYSFATRPDWPEHFSSQPVLKDYFHRVADQHDLLRLIRFGTEVSAIQLDESTSTWTLDLLTDDGREETLEVHAVVSAVGQLNRPNLPNITGVERFQGPAFHSARWDHRVSLAGKRVAVIGTGASAAQFIPEVADQASHLTIFQRTPAWFIPTPDYHDAVSPEALWLFRNVPGYANWYRFWIFWRNVEGLMPAALVDPTWEGAGRSVSELNDGVRQLLTAYLEGEFADAPELLEQVIPDYPPFAKRFIRDNGIWSRTVKRDDVMLVTESIDEITAEGVRTADGTVHEVDVIIYGTGFQASDFLTPMKVVGRGGADLRQHWGGDARAYLGITLPGFPNFFLLYGPNTNIVANGSITYFSECEVHYIVGCIRNLLELDARAMDPRPEVHDAYNELVDKENLRMAWGVSSVNSWYTNATGRSAQNWPFSLLDYWRYTREPNLDDYVLL
jgi:4-hydroxyacetophenone monooxygenase